MCNIHMIYIKFRKLVSQVSQVSPIGESGYLVTR